MKRLFIILCMLMTTNAWSDGFGISAGKVDYVASTSDTSFFAQIWSKGDTVLATLDTLGTMRLYGDLFITTEFAIASYDSSLTPALIPITGSGTYDQWTNLTHDLWEGSEVQGTTVSADSLISTDGIHKRIRFIGHVECGNNQTIRARLNCRTGTVYGIPYMFKTAASDLGENVVLMGHWEPGGIGDALWIEIANSTSDTDVLTDYGFAESSHSGH